MPQYSLKTCCMSRLLLLIGLSFILVSSVFAETNVNKTRIANGFDYPLGKPNADGYYKSRGFRLHGHLGEDWVSEGGSGKIFDNPVWSVGAGVVGLARDFKRAWGNVVVIRHAYLDGKGQVKYIDSLYGHLNKVFVSEGQQVARGQEIGTVGTAHGLYPAHLHFEIHNDLTIGVVHSDESRRSGNYEDPTQFLDVHRALPNSSRIVNVDLHTYRMPSFPGIELHPPILAQASTKASTPRSRAPVLRDPVLWNPLFALRARGEFNEPR
jgi:murein DD-endopeptidase MepM/ murein hydrolase activator NlpD